MDIDRWEPGAGRLGPKRSLGVIASRLASRGSGRGSCAHGPSVPAGPDPDSSPGRLLLGRVARLAVAATVVCMLVGAPHQRAIGEYRSFRATTRSAVPAAGGRRAGASRWAVASRARSSSRRVIARHAPEPDPIDGSLQYACQATDRAAEARRRGPRSGPISHALPGNRCGPQAGLATGVRPESVALPGTTGRGAAGDARGATAAGARRGRAAGPSPRAARRGRRSPALTSTGSAFVIVVVGRSRKTCSSSLALSAG